MSLSIELKYVKLICLEIEDMLGWGLALDWTNSSFIELSNEIKRSSGVRISADTLKRIFGKVKTAEQYNPQQATKDALAVFLECENWSDFKLRRPIPKDELQIVSASPVQVIDISPKFRYKWIVFSLLALLTIVLLFFNPFNNSKSTDYSKYPIVILGKYLTGKAYHTAIFEYDVTTLPTDSVFLDFGDNSSKVRLSKINNTISHYYRGPGRYDVRLIAEEQELYDTTVYLTTENWEAYTFFSKGEFDEYLPIYEFQDSISKIMAVDRDIPKIKGIDTTQMYWIEYANYHRYNLDSDNFLLETELMNNQEIIPARCNHVKVDIIGEFGSVKIYFLKEGCSKWVKLQFGDIALNGETQDLSLFGKDFLDFQKVTIRNENKKVTVMYNGTLLIEQSYQSSLGEILGISYTFSGAGGQVRNPVLNGRSLFEQ